MTPQHLSPKAEKYLHHLCLDIANRRVGSVGNRAATAFFAQAVASLGWAAETADFACIDWTYGDVHLATDGQTFTAQRIPATGTNVIACKTGTQSGKIIVFAHIDSKAGTPGALDNASGVVVLLLLAELLADWNGRFTIEIIALNGEDYYNTPGQIQYLADNQAQLDQIMLGINLDGAGYHEGQTTYSLYGCPTKLETLIHGCFAAHDEMMVGEQWYQGDHAIFYQNQVPVAAITSEQIFELTTDITHTDKDVPALVDNSKLARITLALRDLIRALNGI